MQQRVQIEDIRKIRFLSELKASPDKQHAAFVVRQGDQDDGYSSWLWLYEAKGGTVRQLTYRGSEKDYCWDDNDHLLFIAMRDEQDKKDAQAGEERTVFYRLALDGGEAQRAFSVPLKVNGIRRLPDGRYLLNVIYNLARPDLSGLSGQEREQALARIKREKDYEVLDELPFCYNGRGFVNKLRKSLFLYDEAQDQITRVSAPTCEVMGMAVSQDGTKIAYYGCDYTHMQTLENAVWVYDLASGETKEILSPYYDINQMVFYKEDLLFSALPADRVPDNENFRIYRVSASGGEVKVLSDLDVTYGTANGSDCRLGGGTVFQVAGDSLYYTSVRGGYTALYRLDMDGRETRLNQRDCVIDMFQVMEDHILFVGFVGMCPQELYKMPLEGTAESKITGFQDEYCETHEFAQTEHFGFTDPEGYEIEGWVLKPVGYEPGKKYPGILNIHGGPKTAYGDCFFHEMQHWAGKGYFVMFCNPRGSEGYSSKFAKVYAHMGSYDYENLMQFVDVCLERYPDIDAHRLGVAGGSYGGWMTNWIIGHTNRFRCAASQRSIASRMGSWGYGDVGFMMCKMKDDADIWENVWKKWELSPLCYADNARTPTLFIHSDEDYRCHMVDAFEMFTSLKMHGVDTRICLFHGENHELSRSGKPVHRVRRLKEITDWLDRYLMAGRKVRKGREKMSKLPVAIDDFQKISMLSELKFSPKGTYAAFVQTRADKEESYTSYLYLYERATGRVRKLTGYGEESSFCWEDDRHIIFPGNRSEKARALREKGEEITVYYRLDVTGGEAQEAFSVPMKGKSLDYLSDGKIVITATYDLYAPDLTGLTGEQRERVLAQKRRERDYEVIDELPFFSNGAGFTNKTRRRLYLCDTASGNWKAISAPTYQVSGFSCSQDGRYIVYFGEDYTDIYARMNGIHLYDVQSGQDREMLERKLYNVSQAVIWPDGILFAGTDMKQWGMGEMPKFYTIPLTGGAPRLVADFDRNVGRPGCSDCRIGGGKVLCISGDLAYFSSTDGRLTRIYRLDTNGQITPVVQDEIVADLFDVSDGMLLTVAFFGTRPHELYGKKLDASCLERITDFNTAYYESHTIVEPEIFEFTEPEGYRIDCWVMKPVGYEPGKKYPAILDIHGGPKLSFGETFFHELQFLANQGYFVLYCNPRGGEGQGNAFAKIDMYHDMFDYENLMQFIDVCLERYPDIDPNRLGVQGGSYGGYMTNLIIGLTDRFAAAVSQRSIASWVGMMGHTDVGYLEHYSRGITDLWSKENVRGMWERCPSGRANRIKTPTLFLHSDQDYRCHVVEGLQMYTALQMHGVETRMCLFHGENHELSRSGKPVHRIRRLQEILDWFDSHLKK